MVHLPNLEPWITESPFSKRITVKTKDMEGNESRRMRELWFHLSCTAKNSAKMPGPLKLLPERNQSHKKSTIHCFIHSFYYSSIYQNEIRDIEGWHWKVDFCVKIINHPFEFRYVLSFSFVFSSQMLGVFSCFNTTLVAPNFTPQASGHSIHENWRSSEAINCRGIAGWFPSEVQLLLMEEIPNNHLGCKNTP